MTDQIPLFEIDWDRGEILNATDSITRGSYWAKGPYITEFEEKIEEYLDVSHAITFNSGTTAIESALVAAGVEDGDEVIVPSFTFIATANAVKLAGAEPVFADIDTETYGLDPDDVREKITDDTAAILPIHCYGLPCNIAELQKIAEEYDLCLIEDAAEAFGAIYQGQKVGTFGDMAAFSFCQNKVITTGEGGAVVTNDDDLAQKLKLYRSHGRAGDKYFETTDTGSYVTVGSNYRMPDVVASIGVAQIDRVESIINERRKIGKYLTNGLEQNSSVITPNDPDNSRHVYQIYTIELPSKEIRQKVIELLTDNEIASKIYWDPPVHKTQSYSEHKTKGLSTTSDVSKKVLSLPIYPDLTQNQCDRIISTVKKVINN